MTSRKPPGTSWESWIDSQISASRRRGEFDNLPGAGKPLPDLDKPHDEMWWVRSFLKREGLSFLPETLQLKLDVERGLEDVLKTRSRRQARRLLKELNERIIYVNSRSGNIDGPASTVSPLDIERILEQWDDERAKERAAEMISGPNIAAVSWVQQPDDQAIQRAITAAVFVMLGLSVILLLIAHS